MRGVHALRSGHSFIGTVWLFISFGFAKRYRIVSGLVIYSSSRNAPGIITSPHVIFRCRFGPVIGRSDLPGFQTNWEIKRLRKDIEHLRKEQLNTAKLMAAEAAAHTRHEKTVLDITNENQSPL